MSRPLGLLRRVVTIHASHVLESAVPLAWSSLAVFLGDGLAVGVHTIQVDIVEQGDPWENSRTYTWTFAVNPPEVSTE